MLWRGGEQRRREGEGKVGNEKKRKRRTGRKGKVERKERRWERNKERKGGNYFDQFF